MDRETVKESRRVLRRFQDHVMQAHLLLGAEQQNLGMVDVIYHPGSRAGDFNYVTPRRNTAWVSGNFVQQGIDRMRELNRTPRVQYIEGLFPPLFARTLRDLDLEPEQETPIMIYSADGLSGADPLPITLPPLPAGIRFETVKDQRGVELWWYVWRNAYYDVLTLGVEPIIVGRDMAALHQGKQIDIIVYRYEFPVGVIRLSLQPDNNTAHILALALMREVRDTQMTYLMIVNGMLTAIERGYKLIFAPGDGEEDRRLLRGIGFMDFGSILCYAARPESTSEGSTDDSLVQPVLTFRGN